MPKAGLFGKGFPTLNCVDMSRWGGKLTDEEAQCLIARGIDTIIVGCGHPNGAGTWARQQAECWYRNGGKHVQAYIYLYMAGDPIGQCTLAVFVLDGVKIDRWWMDAEDVDSPELTSVQRSTFLRTCLSTAHDAGLRTGIYSGAWWWIPNMANTAEFANEMLWDSWYPAGARADNVEIKLWGGREYGGFNEPLIYQFKGTTDVCEQSVDLDWNREATMLVFDRYPVAIPPGWISGTYLQVAGYGFPHGGVDIAAPQDMEIMAPCDGVISHIHPVAEGFDFGNWVNIQSEGLFVAFAHMNKFAPGISIGLQVTAGTLIGYVGTTGKSTGNHCHWAVSTNPGFALDYTQLSDPLSYLDQDGDMADNELREIMVGLMRAIPYTGYEQFFQKCQDWIDVGSPVYAEGDPNATEFKINNYNDAVAYAMKRGFRFTELVFQNRDRIATLESATLAPTPGPAPAPSPDLTGTIASLESVTAALTELTTQMKAIN